MKKIISLLLTLCLLAGCGLTGAEKVPEGKPWVNSSYLGNLPEERPAVEDSFDLYVNYDAYAEARDKGTMTTLSAFEEAEVNAQGQILDLCRSTTTEYAEDEVLRILYGFVTDTEKRNADGLAPLMARVDRVKAAETTDDLLALVQEEGFLPCNSFFSISIQRGKDNPDIFVVTVNTKESLLGGPDTEAAKVTLMRMQYSEEEAAALAERMQEYDEYFPEENVEWPEGTVLSIEQLKEKCPLLYAQAVGMGFKTEGPVYEVSMPAEAEAVNHFFTAENLDMFKAAIALKLYEYSVDYLDEETWKAEGSWKNSFAQDRNIYLLIESICNIPVDQAYLKHFCPEENWETVVALLQEYKEAMRNRFIQNTWIDEETRQKCLKKLELIEVAPLTAMGGMFDCEPLKTALQSCSTLLDAAAVCQVFLRHCMLRYAGQPYTNGCHYLMGANKVMTSNGVLNFAQSIIWIGAPALNMPMFNAESRETLLGTIGHHLAHELSHAFCYSVGMNGSGDKELLFSEESFKIYMEKRDAMIAEMNKIEPFEGEMLNGSAKIPELMPDVTGMSLSLDLAKKTEGFDYAEFFRAYAGLFHSCSPNREFLSAHSRSMEVHPLPYIRINYTVAQFDEFYETFPSVKEGTPMYIAPEDRTVIW